MGYRERMCVYGCRASEGEWPTVELQDDRRIAAEHKVHICVELKQHPTALVRLLEAPSPIGWHGECSESRPPMEE